MQCIDQEMFQRNGEREHARHTTVRMTSRHHQPDRVHAPSIDAVFSCIATLHSAETTRMLTVLACRCEFCRLGAHHFSASSLGRAALNFLELFCVLFGTYRQATPLPTSV
jgi:hypothetical protein